MGRSVETDRTVPRKFVVGESIASSHSAEIAQHALRRKVTRLDHETVGRKLTIAMQVR